MSFIYDALKKAQQEGKFDDRWAPKSIDQPRYTPPDLHVPPEVIREFSMLKQKAQQAHEEQGTQVFGVTSSVSGEGRSTIAYFLALMLSHSMNGFYSETDKIFFKDDFQKVRKNGVLLIDGNLERPLLHQLFDTAQSPGLTDFFFNATSNSIFTKSVTANHLYLVTAGSADGNRQEIWTTDRMKNLITKLKENFEYILIDAPPVIGHPETLALSKLADGVLLVIKANQTRLEVIDEAREQLQEAGAKVLGVVLNERRFFIPGGIYRRI